MLQFIWFLNEINNGVFLEVCQQLESE